MRIDVNKMTKPQRKRSQESGYAFLMALFAILIMIAASTVVLQNMRTQAQREKEEEMVWRGKQYERAIRLYFHKTGKYPQDIDALQKGLPDLHFLRQAYKDPMNGDDGSWRFIYVNQAGAIIGSVKYANLQQMALLDTPGGPPVMPGGGLGVPASSLAASSNSSSTQTDPNAPPQPPQNPAQNPAQGFGQNPQNPSQGGSGQNPQPGGPGGFSSGFGQQPGSQSPQSGSPGSMFSSSGGSTGNPLLDMKPTGPVDGPVLGGFLTGVGSKVDRKSVKLYRGAKKYKDWEFIWNPLEDQTTAAQQQAAGLGTQAGQLGQALGSIFGAPTTGAPGAGGNPFGNPNPPGGTSPQQPMPQPQPQQPQPQQP